jgi:hypothetical protein
MLQGGHRDRLWFILVIREGTRQRLLVSPEPVALGCGCGFGWSRRLWQGGHRDRLCFILVRVIRGGTLRISFRLRDYDAISITPIRNERYKTTILVGTTSAFDAVGELDRQLLRTFAGRTLGNMSQYEDK